MKESSKPANPMAKVLQNRDFRLLWLGQATSQIGDQFTMIATPWLVLTLTNDPLALGIAMALAGIPRAIFLLVGGVIVDRLSPRVVMLASDVLRLVLVLLMAVVIWTGATQLWMIYAFNLAFGLLSGFFLPASISVAPSLVDPDDLQAGNAVFMGTGQLAGFIGPAMAGAVISLFAHTAQGAAPGSAGIGLAFGIDAITFIVSVATLWAIQGGRAAPNASGESITGAVVTGVRFTFQQPVLRLLFLISGLSNLLFLGPLLVGIPVLANTRLAEGVVAYGLIMSAFAGGNLLGAVVAGNLPKPRGPQLRIFMAGQTLLGGLALIAFAWISSTWVAFIVMLLLQTTNGYLTIVQLTLMQSVAPRAMLGRLMSLLLFASMGLLPLSQALSGAISSWSLSALFIGAGALMSLFAAWVASNPAFNQIDGEAETIAASIQETV